MAGKIKILFLAANPMDTNVLWLDREVRQNKQTLFYGMDRDKCEVIQRRAPKMSDLERVLSEHQPHIVHFTRGKATTEELRLEDDRGTSKAISKEALVAAF